MTNRSFTPAALGLAVVLTSAACSSDGQSPNSDPAPPPGGGFDCSALDFAAFDAEVAEFVQSRGLVGASAAIVHRECGVVHTRGYGGHSADRIYLVGSASKVLSAGILSRLADDGLLDLDVGIGQYVSGWETGAKRLVTAAQLLSNSSGLVGLVDNPFYLPYRCQYRDDGTLGDCARTIYTANDEAQRKPADTAFRYGGGQWQLAGGVAEAVSGKSWAELVREIYVDPCGLTSLGYTNQFELAADAGGPGSALEYPPFFDGDIGSLPATNNPSVEGGLFTDVGDYARLLLMHLEGGRCGDVRVLSERAVERMREDRIVQVYGGSTAGQTGRTAGGDAAILEGYGLGWWIDRQHPGVFADPGLYGAFPWIDLTRGYGAVFALEADGMLGAELWIRSKPLVDAALAASAL